MIRIWRILLFFPWFVWELSLATLRVARDMILPLRKLTPGVVAIPVSGRPDWQITVIANLITLTPGTLSLDVSPDRRWLFIHTINMPTPQGLRRAMEGGLIRRLDRIFQ
ncbi:MAG: Na+/H+ antiporter subunit E [Bryobacteraceae bacterium]|nr:Na+/H+ antiporter subunit E [Bryobacteraceae bacterium]